MKDTDWNLQHQLVDATLLHRLCLVLANSIAILVLPFFWSNLLLLRSIELFPLGR